MKEIVKINYKGKEYDIDLNGQIHKDLLEKDYKGNLYINIALVREIARVKGWSIQSIKTNIEPLNELLVKTSSETEIVIDNTLYYGAADDIYKLDSLSRSCFPNMARVQALAIKNALKWRYPFFEADYLEAEALGERGLISEETTKEFNSDKFNQLIELINNSKTVQELAPLASQIAKANEKEYISPEQFRDLKKLFSEKNTKLK